MRDAKSLLQGVVPPAGAVVGSSGMGIGPHARLITLALASAVAYRTWTVPGDPASVSSFVQSHLPPGSTVVTTGSGGSPLTQSVTRSWPPVRGILDDRLLEVAVTARPDGGTRLYAEAQSEWVVTRPKGEHIPAGVREVNITDGWPGHPPFLSRRVTSRATVHKLVTLFNSLGIAQPVDINCPAESVTPVVTIGFRTGRTGAPVAEAKVSSAANLPWPASVPGWNCFSISFTVHGRNWPHLVGNVIAPMHRLLHVRFGRR
ncbi:MAG TPA: hypothetical protein VJ741_06475 [Solirubrobacteraceae bacterium]|nr:hypothetical protein [Solirubrobacteraceae bacterium]